VTKPLLAIAVSWPMVLATRILDRFAKGLRGSARDALIAESATPESRGRAFGFHRSFDQMGAVIGPLLALPVLAAMGGDFRAVFALALAPGLLSTLITLFVRDRPKPPPPPAAGDRKQPGAGPITPALKTFLAITLLFALGNSSDAFLILRARQLGMEPATVVLLFTLFNLTYVLAAYPAGRLSDRVPRRWLIACGYAVFAFVYGGMGLVSTTGPLWPLFALYGLYMGLAEGIARAYVVDLAGTESRGTALGIHATAIGIGALPASVMAGAMWAWWGPHVPFLFGAATAALSSLLLLVTAGRSRSAGLSPGL
jgi:MFS family permease